MTPAEEFLEVVQRLPDGPVLIHSDLMKARLFVPSSLKRAEQLNLHLDFLRESFGKRDLFFPCFNYSFPSEKKIDLSTAQCQVGVLGEFVRTLPDSVRSFDPMFSVTTIKSNEGLCFGQVCEGMTAFDMDSVFGHLDRSLGSVCFYGAPFSSATIIHYVEKLAGGPIYRYDKSFDGIVVDSEGVENPMKYVYHVRPMGVHLDYDWPRLLNELINQEIVRTVEYKGVVISLVCAVADLKSFWLEKLHKDPFFLLDQESLSWVVPKYRELGRRFLVSDFE